MSGRIAASRVRLRYVTRGAGYAVSRTRSAVRDQRVPRNGPEGLLLFFSGIHSGRRLLERAGV